MWTPKAWSTFWRTAVGGLLLTSMLLSILPEWSWLPSVLGGLVGSGAWIRAESVAREEEEEDWEVKYLAARARARPLDPAEVWPRPGVERIRHAFREDGEVDDG